MQPVELYPGFVSDPQILGRTLVSALRNAGFLVEHVYDAGLQGHSELFGGYIMPTSAKISA